MAFKNSVLFFGDQTVEPSSFIQSLHQQSKESPALQRFFGETTNALRLEISSLSEDERQSLPTFSSPLDLVECSCVPSTRAILSTVLTCFAQLGDFIRRVEKDPSLLGCASHSLAISSAPLPKRRIIGFCSGLLAAAAAAVATNLSDLTSIACHITLVSLRVGLHVHQRSSLIEQASDKSWSVAVSGASAAECRALMDSFCSTKSIPLQKRVYISSETASNVVVSGPPSVLTQFVSECSSRGGFRFSRLPIFAAFHASHLPDPRAESIIGSSVLFSTIVPAGTKLIDPSSGTPYPGENLSELLQDALDHIFKRQLFPAKTVECALKGLLGASSELTFSIFGPTNAENFLRQSVKAAGFENVQIQVPEIAKSPTRQSSEAIAIVGMSGRFPGSESLQGFWDTLVQNKDLHQTASSSLLIYIVPKNRWDADLHVDATGQQPNTAHSAYGCFLDRPGAFDGSIFNTSPRESMQTDPVQRLLLMTTYEALEMAGYRYDVKPDRSRIGAFVGIATDDWREYNISQDVNLYFVTGGLRSFASGRLNYFFKFEGPSYVVDTACSSSGAAMELACASLLGGKCDMAIAGGGNVMTGPNLWAGLGRGGFISPTGSCKTFDETADGYCRGEGVGVVVLKRLADAIAEGDQIQGVIRGISTNHSANAPSITQPHAATQEKLYKEVLREAGIRPDQVDYVEMHGTGTQAGDVAEMQSVVSTFGPGRQSEKPLYVGSVKPNVGHGEGAAAVTGLIKTLMMFRENVIPPHAGVKTRLNPKLPQLEQANIRIARRVEPFLPMEEPRRVLVNSFGATGGNTSLVVEEPPKLPRIGQDPRSCHVVALSAKGQSSLRGNKQRLLDFLTANPNMSLKDISYTSTARRPHHALRSAFCVSNVKELRKALTLDLTSKPFEETDRSNNSDRTQARLVFMFPGQGANFCGLAKMLYHTCLPFQQSLTQLDDIARSLDLPSFIHRVLDDQTNDVGQLSPVRSHLAIVAIEIALARLLNSWGLHPSAVVGHSLGEFAALCIAKVLTVADTLLLVGRRAQLVEELCTRETHGMLAVQASADRIKSMLQNGGAGAFEIACINGPESTVVSGSKKTLENIQTVLNENHRIKSSYVSVPYSFHSTQLDPILNDYRRLAGDAIFSRPAVPVASTLLGRMVEDEGTFSASYMAEQTRKPVQFEAAIRAVQSAGLVTDKTLFIETGPGTMCISMTQAILATSCRLLPCLKSPDSNWKTISRIVAEAYCGGISVDWSEYHRPYKSSLTPVDLPSYHFNLNDYWIQYNGGVAALQSEITQLKAQLATRPALLEEHWEEVVVEVPPISTCLHQILVEVVSNHESTVEFSTNLQEANLRKLVAGHKVIGIALAPSSLFTEMALEAAQYLYDRLPYRKPVLAFGLHNLVISSPLFLNKESTVPQLVNIRATVKPDAESIQITINSEGKQHCRCTVDLEAADWTRDWSRRCYLFQDRVRRLMSASPAESVHHLLKNMVYKVFFPITEYSGEYQCISDIYIDQSFREAAVRLDLRNTPEEYNFTVDPCWLDSIAQTAGFVLNSDVANPDDMICMATGCDSLRLSKTVTGGKQYLCHVRAESVDEGGNNLVCDVTIFDDDGIVALGEGLKFKRIKKQLLQRILELSPAENQTSKLPVPVVSSQSAKHIVKVHTPTAQVQTKTSTIRAASIPPSFNGSGFQQTVIQPFNRTIIPAASSETAANTPPPQINVGSVALAVNGRKISNNLELQPAYLRDGATAIPKPSGDSSENGMTVAVDAETNDKDETVASDRADTSSTNGHVPSSLWSSEQLGQSVTSVGSREEQEEIMAWDIPDLMGVILDAIVEGTGLSQAEVGEDMPFADMGIDSLMSVAIIGAVKDSTGQELPANLFSECETIVQVRQVLEKEGKVARESDHDEQPPSPLPSLSAPILPTPPPERSFNADDYESKAVLLQGRPRSPGPILFLVTDGGGSAAVYVQLPPLAPDLTVYALDSPFIRGKEEDFLLPGITTEDVASIFARAVRAVQPQGPYMLGGYSIGGVFAYALTRHLINTGDRVHSFLAIDAACPGHLKGIIDVNVEICERMGMYDSISEEDQRKPLTDAQKVHVAGCVQATARSNPVPVMPEDRPEHVYCIWARIGFLEHMAPKILEVGREIAHKNGRSTKFRPEWLEWLESEKKSFGPRGWEKLFGDNIETFVLDGDHFSIIMRPRVKLELGPLCQKLMKRILSTLDKSDTPRGTSS